MPAGRKPSPHARLHKLFVDAVRTHARSGSYRSLSVLAGYPHHCQLSYVLRHHIVVSDDNVKRLTNLAAAVGYDGPLFA